MVGEAGRELTCVTLTPTTAVAQSMESPGIKTCTHWPPGLLYFKNVQIYCCWPVNASKRLFVVYLFLALLLCVCDMDGYCEVNLEWFNKTGIFGIKG